MAKVGTHKATEFLKDILINKYYMFIDTWLRNATTREQTGLKILMAVYVSRGLRRLSEIHSMHRSIMSDLSTHSDYPSLKLNSDFLSVLTEKCKTYLSSWFSMETRKHYLSLVLSFLKGFYSITLVGSLPQKPKLSQRPAELTNIKDFNIAFQTATPRERKFLLLKGNEELKEVTKFLHCGSPAKIPYKSYSVKVNSDFHTSLISRRMPEQQLNYKLL